MDWSQPDSGHLNPKVMDELDYFIAECAKLGIYSRLTMLWYRKMKKGDDPPMYDEAVAAQKDNKKTLNSMGITFFDDKVMDINIALEKAIMTHKNPYRDNKAYGEDPAICQTEVTNEDGMFFYTIDGIPPCYKAELDKLWSDWLLKKYGSRDKLARSLGRRHRRGGTAGQRHHEAPAHLELQQRLRSPRPRAPATSSASTSS